MDNTQYYGAVSRFFHWTMAAAFAFMLFTAIQFKQENTLRLPAKRVF